MFLIITWVVLILIIYILWNELITISVFWKTTKLNDRNIKNAINMCDRMLWGDWITPNFWNYFIAKVPWIFNRYYINFLDWNKNMLPTRFNKIIEQKITDLLTIKVVKNNLKDKK